MTTFSTMKWNAHPRECAAARRVCKSSQNLTNFSPSGPVRPLEALPLIRLKSGQGDPAMTMITTSDRRSLRLPT